MRLNADEISWRSGTPKPLIGTLGIWWLVSANHIQYKLLELGMMNIANSFLEHQLTQ